MRGRKQGNQKSFGWVKTDISFGQTQCDETIYLFSPQYVQIKFEKSEELVEYTTAAQK